LNGSKISIPASSFQPRENRIVRAATLFAQGALFLEQESRHLLNLRHAVKLRVISDDVQRALRSLRRAGCVIHNLYWPKAANGERRSQYRLIWCPSHLAPENHPATLGPRPNLPTKSTKAQPGLPATKAQIEHSRSLSFQPGPLEKAGIDPTAVSFRLDPAAPNRKSRSAEVAAPIQPPLFAPQRSIDPKEGSRR
jgi:hypothetical protein